MLAKFKSSTPQAGRGLRVRKDRDKNRAGAGVAGAGTGALLVHLLRMYNGKSPWIPMLLYLAPTLSVAITASVLWLKRQLDQYVRRKFYDKLRDRLTAIANDPNETHENREQASRALAELRSREISALFGEATLTLTTSTG